MGFALMLTVGGRELLTRDVYGTFYDAQASALLAGHWDVPAKAMFFEGFRLHGRTYTYFGIWPSLLRMPVVELAPSLVGRLTRLSMLAGFGVFLGAVIALHWRIRNIFRPDTPVGRSDLALSFVVPIVAGCGSCALFLASRAWVYHEAIVWGVAWSLVAYERMIAFSLRPSRARLAGASAGVALALASRASLGFGALLALTLIVGGTWIRAHQGGLTHINFAAWHRVRSAVGTPGAPVDADRSRSPLTAPLLAAAVVIPIGLFAYVNWSRFGSFFTVPWRHQVLFQVRPQAARALDANGGSYFGLQYLPTTLWQSLRPDALGRSLTFPWVTFPRFRTVVFGGAVIDMLDVSSSVPASMPGLTILTGVGSVAAFSRRTAMTCRSAVLRAPLIGAASGIGFVLTIAFIAQRYLGDWLPLLILGSIAGWYSLLERHTTCRTRTTRRFLAGMLVVVSALAFAGVWINGSLAYVYQRLYNPQPDTLRAGAIAFQSDVDRMLGGSGVEQVDQVRGRLGVPAPAGTTRVVGNCAGMYWSDGTQWHLVEGSPVGGVLRLRAALPPADTQWHPLVSWGSASGARAVVVRRAGDHVRVALASSGVGSTPRFGPHPIDLPLRNDRLHEVEFVAVAPINLLRVRIGGDDAYLGELGRTDPENLQVGRSDLPGIASSYGPPLQQQAPEVSTCRTLLDRLR
ncbi:MAG: hypothetical protein ABIP21_03775 [Acidimicrobiia bacterium]